MSSLNCKPDILTAICVVQGKDLLECLLEKYDKRDRPVRNKSHTIHVVIRPLLHQIVDLVGFSVVILAQLENI